MQPQQGKQPQQPEVPGNQGVLENHRAPLPAWLAPIAAVGLIGCAVALVSIGDPRSSARLTIFLILAAVCSHAVLCIGLSRRWKHWNPQQRRRIVVAILALSVLLRCIMLLLPPSLSDDIYRYRWDGKVQAAGHNPYLEPPAAASLEPLRDPQWERINYRRIRSIYPPLAQVLFLSAYSMHHSVGAFQLLALLGDLLTIVLVVALIRAWALPRWTVALYACHPLPAIEFASSGHYDAWVMAAVLAAILAHHHNRRMLSTVALAAGVLLKTWPLVFVPLMLRRRPRAHIALFGGLVVVAFLPFAGAGLRILQPWLDYAGRWRFNDGIFYVLAELTGSLEAGKAIAAGIGLALAGWLWRRDEDPVRGGYWLLLAFILLMPTIHPWYILWAMPLAALAFDIGWLTLCGLAPLAYWILTNNNPDSNAWIEPWWPRLVEYLPALAVWAWQWRRRGFIAAPGRLSRQ